ncbi:type III secretion system outer membrane ring subunit SctC [Paraburkholderia youngii]|uniref:Type 3 secretion system secretin n=1 Tax=Paraburkholderia youngii TaxID=2782701 RepID=A0A7Y6K893_9BURK|nr:type III secretion system outer membrane ring subunit SctC [Paraburkholderia youngii]NUY06266.1 type III secretion system outer membrane ring subunit SctC [Paraburkholderia youngii]
MKSTTLFRAILVAALISAGVSSSTHARPVRWRNQTVHIHAQGKNLTDILRDFTASQGITTSIASNVQGTVSGEFNMTPQRFLDTLASTFGLVWFYDGNILSISNANDVTRQVIYLDQASPARLVRALRSMRLDDPRFPVTYDAAAGIVLVNGPPQYVQVVRSIAQRVDQSKDRTSGSVVRVFKLHHAWADDHKVQIDGQNITVAGVASVLSSIYHPRRGLDNAPASGSPSIQRVQQMSDLGGNADDGGLSSTVGSGGGDGAPQILVPPLPSNLNAGATYGGAVGGMTGNPGAAGGDAFFGGNSNSNNGGGSGGVDASLPVIQADPITNSVLVRDVPQRIDQYDALISPLDVRPKVIEIEANIIEIDDDLLKQIGIDWRAHSSHLDLQTGSGTTSQTGNTSSLNPSFGTTTLSDGTAVMNSMPVGGSITALLGDAGRYLLARVNASESTTLAKIDATPKVATLDNVEAVMDNKTRFFVRVSGYTSADLYSISTGVSLRVLPMVAQENGETRIKLTVHIEDGQIAGDQTVDTLPVITESVINTQAFVTQGESLLIVGYSTDAESNGTTIVPGNSKIPVLGALFRNNSDSRSHMKRIFLLTPRMIEF